MSQSIPFKSTGQPRRIQGWYSPIDGVEIPYFMNDSGNDGLTLLYHAGIHGGEDNAIETARDFIKNPVDLVKGKMVILPIVNLEAHKARVEFLMPQDGKNLNRVFPGNAEGTISERLADWLCSKFYPKGDLLIDGHSGDMEEQLNSFVACIGDHPASKELARAAQLPDHIVVELKREGNEGLNGTAILGAVQAGIPAIVIEVGSNARWNPRSVLLMRQTVCRVLISYGMVDRGAQKDLGKPSFVKPKMINAEQEGCWIQDLEGRGAVKMGEVLGRVETFDGKVLQTIYADEDAKLLYWRTAHWVVKGADLVALGVPKSDYIEKTTGGLAKGVRHGF